MGTHPELAAEQAYVDHAYDCLDRAREAAVRLRSLADVGRGGTHQARYERDVIEDTIRARLSQLELGDEALVFGRIDRGAGETFHIGRLAVSDDRQEPVVVDWRAPVAEPFYRATGRVPMGLVRRRHFMVKGRTLLDLEDELFDLDHLEGAVDGREINGYGALISALEQSRTGKLRDIVATIQGEQDEVIRSEPGGVMVVQGGPGTGKTVVALHRAAYLLYTHRFPLEDQGVLVVGPNRVFLRYIDRVLPSLGEAGVELVVLADLVPDVRVRGTDHPDAARVKGDARMSSVLTRAVRDRERPLRADLVVGYGLTSLRLTADESARIVRQARRRFRRHNAARRFVEQAVFAALAGSGRDSLNPTTVRDRVRRTDEVRAALEWMWPVLTPAELLHDLFGSLPLLRSAGRGVLDDRELVLLHRGRSLSVADVVWTAGDVALLDEARSLLGSRPTRGDKGDDDVRTYGHIVVDEAQDLTPMQLRMLARRSLNGSMTVVGDIAQATGPFAPDRWDDVLAHLPDRKPSRLRELTIGYRIPSQAMALAARVLSVAAPGLAPPSSVREGEDPPHIRGAGPDLGAAVADEAADALAALGEASVAVIVPESLVGPIEEALEVSGLDVGRADRQGLERPVTVVPVGLVKGLELDAAVVVEPSRIVAEEAQGLRALYVALTRATKRLAVVHAEPLPDALAE
ncbi:MAG: AAA family ATPase [Acidimicrobiales bacterium]|nr:AAA family ATPase [Acidimicrobiales bacterium]